MAPAAGGAGIAAGGAPAFGRGFRRGGRGAPVYTGTELTPEVRSAMKQEVDAYFGYVMREDRSVLELLKSNYTFVNAALAPVYGIANVNGLEMRKVELPESDPRGGVLTMGSVLTVTSNPTRTSPVKRGKWILENILGAPTAPPPPNVPALEDSISKAGDHQPTQREVLAIHRENALCASCHARMDPLGLALENFNAFGRFRSMERQQPIDPAGELITGEKFAGAGELKEALVTNHKMEFYRTLTSKLLTYVLGRGMEYYDTVAIDEIAERMDKEDGRFSALLMGVLESAPVQKTRPAAIAATVNPNHQRRVTMNPTNSSESNPVATAPRFFPAPVFTQRGHCDGASRNGIAPASRTEGGDRCIRTRPVSRPRLRPVPRSAPPFCTSPTAPSRRAWWPKGSGKDFTLNRTMEPLANVKDKIQILGGLNDVSANPGADGGGDHARANGTFLTGVRIKKTNGADFHAGISADQVMAQQIGLLTPFRSLELSCDVVLNVGACDTDYACVYQHNLAWSSPTTPLTPEVNPRQLFERLFGAGTPKDRAQNLQIRQAAETFDSRFPARASGPIWCAKPRSAIATNSTNTSPASAISSSALRQRKTPAQVGHNRSRTPPMAFPKATRNMSGSCTTCSSWRSRPIPRASPRS